MDDTSTTTSTVNDAAAALAFADSSLAPPADPAVASPAPAETGPAAAESVSEGTEDPRSPFIPRARFDEVNTQKGQLAEQLKQYEWAKDYKPEDLQSVATWTKAFASNPVEAILHAIQTVEANPQHAQALRSHFARQLSAARKPAEPAADPEPEPDLQAADGTLVYSATKHKEWREWNNRQLTAQFRKELQPLQDVAQTFQQREALATYHTTTAQVVAEMAKADPEFDKHKADVGALIQSDPDLLRLAIGDERTPNVPPNPRLAIRMAWAEVYRTKLAPQQLKQSEAQALTHLQQRAVAATTNPATASSATPKPVLGDARAALEFANQTLGAA